MLCVNLTKNIICKDIISNYIKEIEPLKTIEEIEFITKQMAQKIIDIIKAKHRVEFVRQDFDDLNFLINKLQKHFNEQESERKIKITEL